jgi:holliday junction DNA helicase RuvA
MIGRLTGRLIAKQPPQIVLEVQGVGYELDVPMSTLYQLPATGSEVALYTHLLVREDAHQLFGFASEDERALFRQLLRISGVGARTALAVLSGMSVADLRAAVAGQDAVRFTRIPGIGKKTAERLLLELKDKLELTVAAPRADDDTGTGDVLSALVALGYSEKEAQHAVRTLAPGLSVTEGIRHALKALSRA